MKLTREEINQKLEMLRKSNMDSGNYYNNRGSLDDCVTCYTTSFPFKIVYKFSECNNCGKSYEFKAYKGSVEKINDVIKKLNNSGVEAKFITNCEECQVNVKLKAFEVWVKLEHENDWNISCPAMDSQRLISAMPEEVSFKEYDYVYRFLLENKDLSYSNLKIDKRFDIFKIQHPFDIDSKKGLFKTKMDVALYKVLGLKINYTELEVIKNAEYLLKNLDIERHIPWAILYIKSLNKKLFTLNEYIQAIKFIYYEKMEDIKEHEYYDVFEYNKFI